MVDKIVIVLTDNSSIQTYPFLKYWNIKLCGDTGPLTQYLKISFQKAINLGSLVRLHEGSPQNIFSDDLN